MYEWNITADAIVKKKDGYGMVTKSMETRFNKKQSSTIEQVFEIASLFMTPASVMKSTKVQTLGAQCNKNTSTGIYIQLG